MKKLAVSLFLLLGIITLIALPCLAAETKSAAPVKTGKEVMVKTPVVKLKRVEVASYWGYNPAGSPLVLSFVYSMQNPTNKNFKLTEIRFAVFFEDAEVNTLTYFEENNIPAKSTDFFKITGTFDSKVVASNPNVKSSKVLTEKKISSADLVKQWWEEIGDFTFPITVNGTATFVGSDGKNIIVPFEGTFPTK